MTILAIETSGALCSVALFSPQTGLRQQRMADVPNRSAEQLLVLIDQLMRETALSPEQVDYIAFSEGPGSFTGIRLAVSVAQALAFAWRKCVMPVSTFAAIAWDYYQAHGERSIAICLDARKQEVSFGVFAIEQGRVIVKTPVAILAPEQVVLPEDFNGAMLNDASPSALAVAALADQQRSSAVSLLAPKEALPLYLREVL